MIRVLVCCGGGFSSSFMSKNVNKGIKDKGYEGYITCDFLPFGESKIHEDDYDVIMCCPHLRYKLEERIKQNNSKIPYYVIPAKMYGQMAIEDVYQEAKDIIEGYKKDPSNNPFKFPGEENNVSMRLHCYKKDILKLPLDELK